MANMSVSDLWRLFDFDPETPCRVEVAGGSRPGVGLGLSKCGGFLVFVDFVFFFVFYALFGI